MRDHRDFFVRVGKFYFPVIFIVLHNKFVEKPYSQVPIILGQTFLAIASALIICRNGVMKFSFRNMTVKLNVFNSSQQTLVIDYFNDVKDVNL